MTRKRPLRVVELFAGVGGFRLGLEGKPGSKKTTGFKVVWSNQWEPATGVQHAADIYRARWGEDANLDCRDINVVLDDDFDSIPEHDVLTGGFPCQDYSVAKPLSQAAGIQGKKGVLWWCIYELIRRKEHKPKYLVLENVDRLLKSPADHRGRDFAVMLSSLAEQGYAVEWRVINAAEYGFPQRRKRVFIVGYHQSTALYKKMKTVEHLDWVANSGVLAIAFPAKTEGILHFTTEIGKDPVEISRHFGNRRDDSSPFCNAGAMIDYRYFTCNVKPEYYGPRKVLKHVLQSPKVVDSSFYVPDGELNKWKYLKGAKSEPRKTSQGFTYNYSEGAMSFPDPIDRPARTIVTGEGGSSPSRFKHVIHDGVGYRRLTPIELERLSGFPANHTRGVGISDQRRAFFMGNALVVGAVERIGKSLLAEIRENEPKIVYPRRSRTHT